jgi:ubiquinone/menaquinone biosynthesis C-methylase UbiE
VRQLLALGYDAIGIEPVEGWSKAAATILGDTSRIRRASSENLTLPDNSQRVVLFESVLEHVDSPNKSLLEAYRVLSPEGVAFVCTTNKYMVSPTGRNGEFNVRFYNWFPNIVKEGYVFKHLHYDPRLANYTPCPAVHWFNYSELCRIGRSVGFSQFYSFIDLLDVNSPSIKKSFLRKWLLNKVRYNPWLRALALLQFGNSIFMLKRGNNLPARREY